MNDLILEEETLKRLEDYPEIQKIVIATQQRTYPLGQLTPMTMWFRERYEDKQEEMVELLGWSDEVQEEFWSWGHNSRWANVFEWMMCNNFDDYVNTMIDIFNGEYDDTYGA